MDMDIYIIASSSVRMRIESNSRMAKVVELKYIHMRFNNCFKRYRHEKKSPLPVKHEKHRCYTFLRLMYYICVSTRSLVKGRHENNKQK